MENLEHKYNIIAIDEDFIGKVSNLEKYFIESLSNYIKENESGTEDIISEINIINDILQKLYMECNNADIVRICYNPMGIYYINKNGLER